MRIERGARRALNWQLDAEHEAFRGLGARSALRLSLVLAALVLVFGLIGAGLAAPEASYIAQAGRFPDQQAALSVV